MIPETDARLTSHAEILKELGENGFKEVGAEHVKVAEVLTRIESFDKGEAPFVYDGFVSTAPGTMFTFDEIRKITEPALREGIVPDMAFSFHGNMNLMKTHLTKVVEREGEADVYKPTDRLRFTALSLLKAAKAMKGEVFPLGDAYTEWKVGLIQNYAELIEGPEHFMRMVEESLQRNEEATERYKDATAEEQKLNCAVINTADKLWLSSLAYKYLFDGEGENIKLFLEDSALSAENKADENYLLTFDQDYNLRVKKNGDYIRAQYVFGCVDETAGTRAFVRNTNPHNAKYITIGSRGNRAIEAFLDSGNPDPTEPGFISLHYLHPEEHPVVVPNSARSVSNSTSRFEHLAQVIALQNDGDAEIIIQGNMLPYYQDMIMGLKGNEKHGINAVRLYIVEEEGQIRVFQRDFLAA